MSYISKSSGVIILSLLIFTGTTCKKDKVVPPTVITSEITEISNTAAISGGNAINDGGSSIVSKGVCWNATGNPTIANIKVSNGTGTGTFTSNITGLSSSTIYHVRAYATNAYGTAYGADIQFITATPIVLPTVTTTGGTLVTYNTAATGGNVVSEGGASATRGICWATHTTPTLSDTVVTSSNTGVGAFTINLTGLTPNTTYYVKSYATNNLGSSYGNEISFTTTQSPSAFDFKIKNLDPPSESYTIKEGNCGEAVLWTICQYFGKQLSQQQINYIGGNPGRGLHGGEVIWVLDSLKIPFNKREKADTWENTVDTLRNIIMRGNPIIVGVKLYPDLHPEWYCDHFILFTGTNTLNKVFYYNSVSNSYSITYAKLCDTSNGPSLVNKFNVLFALEILLPH